MRVKAIILAGGSGERFWPLSTPERPKQFLSVFGGESLIRQAVHRLKGAVAPEDIYIVTSAALRRVTCRELPEIPQANVIGEPLRRDTGAAVALGVARAGEGVLAFFPADQLVTRPAAFRASLRQAVSLARRVDTVVTLGIRPSGPSSQFGYVDPVRGRFVEKPDAATARRYLKKGFLWNAGMFIARAEVFRGALAVYAPELADLAAANPRSGAALARRYAALPRISFDYAVMEKLPRVEVIPTDCGWDDVGGYDAYERHFPEAVDAEGNLLVAADRPIKCLGVRNLVIVSAADGVLVIDKSHLGEMKRLFRK